jgi:hypothetical protein
MIEALAKAASRHESQARWHGGGTVAREHDEKAAAMRKLRARLMVPEDDYAERAEWRSAAPSPQDQ